MFVHSEKEKFTVEAKSTKNKLSSVNAGRLAGHREKIGGAYTIVVTPRYVPAVLQDIRTSPIVIIRANTFSEYLYNCIDNDIREIDYEDFDSIIVNNLGRDISKNISDLTIFEVCNKKLNLAMITITRENNMDLMARYPDKYFELAIVDHLMEF
jgi:hypothetical protein